MSGTMRLQAGRCVLCGKAVLPGEETTLQTVELPRGGFALQAMHRTCVKERRNGALPHMTVVVVLRAPD